MMTHVTVALVAKFSVDEELSESDVSCWIATVVTPLYAKLHELIEPKGKSSLDIVASSYYVEGKTRVKSTCEDYSK